jgi:alpha-beta hydrolase superfamily lysophospholipase
MPKLLAGLLLLAAQLLASGCDSSQLRTWHMKKLDGEFSEKTRGEISSLGDYLKLEQALFEQLDKKFYDHSPGGAQNSLQRYSNGSLADPRQRDPDWNRTFELVPATPPTGGVLLLHGMSDSPYSLRALGESLQQRGFLVLGLRMPGHGTVPSGLTTISWEEMSQVVQLGMDYLGRKLGQRPLHIIGYSTGAALAVDYALEADERGPQAASLVLISPAIGVARAAALAGWIKRMSVLPGLRRLAWQDLEQEFDPYKYNSFAINAGEQVHRLTRSISARLQQRSNGGTGVILPPTLVLKSTVDATVSNEAVIDRLLMRLQPNRHELVLFDINRFVPLSTLLVDDPGPMTDRLIADANLPFDFTLVTNTNPGGRAVSAFHKKPFTTQADRTAALGTAWPPGVFSLSHVALPFSPDDPLYGRTPPADPNALFLGQLPLQGERGLLRVSASFLLRLRHNPFYDYLEQRVIDWMEAETTVAN